MTTAEKEKTIKKSEGVVEKTTKPVTKTAEKKTETAENSSEKFAVIRTGSKQYIVKVGDVLKIEKIHDEDIKAGKVIFDDVLLIDDGKTTTLGTPIIKSSKVIAEVIDQVKDKKVVVIKYRAKSRYFKKRGHRQPKTFIRISEIK